MDESIQQIEENQIKELKNGHISVMSLEKLKVQLRDDANRESETVTKNISAIVQSFNKIIKENIDVNAKDFTLLVGIYQFLVNLVARSDRNREFFINESREVHEFWKLTQSLLDRQDDSLKKLIFTFLGQFIVESQSVRNYMRFLHNQGFHKLVYLHLDDNNLEAFDVGYELIKSNADHLDISDTTLIERTKSKLDHYFQEEEDTEILEKLVEIIAYSGPDKDAFGNVLSLLPQVADKDLARKMFVVASLLFTNKPADIPFNQLTTRNPYVFAVCGIAIGNCIKSDATKELTYKLIDANFGINNLINMFFKKFKITDVIQVQAIHMWTNLMDLTISNEIIKQYTEELIALNRIVIDNSQYYCEIAALYFKFLKKLLILTPEEVPMAFVKQMSQLDNNMPGHIGVKYILLQKLNFDIGNANNELLQLIKSIVAQVDHLDVLEQIKTISIINQHLNSGKFVLNPQTITEIYLQPLTVILKQMHESEVSSTPDANSWQAKAFKNNLKYTAAITTKVVELISGDLPSIDFDELNQICAEILLAE